MKKLICLIFLSCLPLSSCSKHSSSGSGNPFDPNRNVGLVDVDGLWSGTVYNASNNQPPSYFNMTLLADANNNVTGEVVLVSEQGQREIHPVNGTVDMTTMNLSLSNPVDNDCGGSPKLIDVVVSLRSSDSLDFTFTGHCSGSTVQTDSGSGLLARPFSGIPNISGNWHGTATNSRQETSTINSSNLTQESQLVYGTINVTDPGESGSVTADRIMNGQVLPNNKLILTTRKYNNSGCWEYTLVDGTIMSSGRIAFNTVSYMNNSCGTYAGSSSGELLR